MDYNSALKRNEILVHVTTCMNHEDVMLREIRQSHKGKYDSNSMRYPDI